MEMFPIAYPEIAMGNSFLTATRATRRRAMNGTAPTRPAAETAERERHVRRVPPYLDARIVADRTKIVWPPGG